MKVVSTYYYANIPMHYTEIFKGCKTAYFQMIFCYSFVIFAKNIDRGHTLETPQ